MPNLARFRKPRPSGAVLSNGNYWSALSENGTGVAFFRLGEGWVQTYGWRPDVVDDVLGWLFYLRDRRSGLTWSAAPAPRPHANARYRFRRRLGVASIECWTGELHTQLEGWVDSPLPREFRHLVVRNLSRRVLEIDVTTYLEVVLFPFASFGAHPAFAKLFVQTAWLPERLCLVAHRRPRSSEERWPVLFLAARGSAPVEYETDRMSFIGRGRDLRCPRALASTSPLSGTVGNVLDPVLSMRQVLTLQPGETAELEFVCGVVADEGALEEGLGRDWGTSQREESLKTARARQQELLRVAGLRFHEARRAEELAVSLLYQVPDLRSSMTAPETKRAAAVRAQLGLDTSRRLVVADDGEQAPWWIAASRYWQAVGLPIDVLLARAQGDSVVVRRADVQHGAGDHAAHLSNEDYRALLALADGCDKHGAASARGRGQRRNVETLRVGSSREEPAQPAVEFWNGFGGFGREGKEYVVRLREGHLPPLPWVNVIANPEFGCLVSERGIGFTWSQNSREFRLTAWSNDPVVDPPSECLYLRDESTGEFWSLLPAPCGSGVFEVTHGQGFTRWVNEREEIISTATCFVPPDARVRVVWVQLVNQSSRPRRCSLWAYHRLVLGAEPWAEGRYVVTDFDAQAGILWARNPQVALFEGRVVFAALGPATPWIRTVGAGDRVWFLGLGGSLKSPRVLQRSGLGHGPVGAGRDPAAILAGEFILEPGQRWEGAVLLGEAESELQGRQWVERYRQPASWSGGLQATAEFWSRRLSPLQVETPWRDLDMLVNHWLLYQTTSCRLWGRSAFYQSGGAYGFRDQLQDACALLWSHPSETRAQILLHAAHQFPEGDVLHWWHPPWEKGTRTRFSDDLLWLPAVTAWYVAFTGDRGILDELGPFVRARSLRPGEDEAYLPVQRTADCVTLYEHCCRAIDRSLTSGQHGLPLMGTGDWNDGMNRVGREGKGESVWLGFFLAEVLARFLPFCEARGDQDRVQRYRAYREKLVRALETHGWDGAWYRRAYFDDGTPLGSAENAECQIDALVQAWAVLSGVASPQRAERALKAVEEKLVDPEAKLIRLLAPPFDRAPQDPGYIKGYLPGVRENGGQYTHAAIWVVQAFFRAGLRDRAAELLRYLLPTEHSTNFAGAERYKVEPYVVAADIYGADPHRGRGGWTWYTGSAGWLYRLVVETLLGITLEEGRVLMINPSLPTHWPGFRVRWRVPGVGDVYHLRLVQVDADPMRQSTEAWLDGKPLPSSQGAVRVPLVHDGKEHEVVIHWVQPEQTKNSEK